MVQKMPIFLVLTIFHSARTLPRFRLEFRSQVDCVESMGYPAANTVWA